MLAPPPRFERATVRAVVNLPPALLRPLTGPSRVSPEGFVLDSQVQALAWLMRVSGQPDLYEGGVERARQRMLRSANTLDPKDVVGVTTEDRMVPGAADSRRARVYRPDGVRAGLAPGLVYFHGGGFVLGSIESHDGVCRALASKSQVVVVSVDYRLAPEHPFPCGIDDAVAATRWVLDNAATVGIAAGAVAVGGDSAGGALASVVAQTLRGAAKRPAFQLLLYPATDATRQQLSHKHFAEGLFLTGKTIDWFIRHYLPSPEMASDIRASPVLAPDLSGLPPAFVLTAGFDPLRDEGRLYAERMKMAGVDVEYVCGESSVHGFMNMAGVLREPARLLEVAADRLHQGLRAKRAVSSAA